MAEETLWTLAEKLQVWQASKPQDPLQEAELFECCLDTARRAVRTTRSINLAEEYFSEFSLYVAEELYLLVVSRGDIQDHCRYIRSSMRGYLDDWCRLQSISKLEDEEERSWRYDPNAPSRYTSFEMEAITDKDITVELIRELFSDLHKCIRYTRAFTSSVSRINAHISIDLSIKYGKFTPFRLSSADASVCRYLYNKFRVSLQKILMNAHIPVISDSVYIRYTASQIRGDFDESEES